jgi:hypothetical protein
MSTRRVYFNGTYWLVHRAHARARRFVWIFQGIPKLGQTWRAHGASR